MFNLYTYNGLDECKRLYCLNDFLTNEINFRIRIGCMLDNWYEIGGLRFNLYKIIRRKRHFSCTWHFYERTCNNS